MNNKPSNFESNVENIPLEMFAREGESHKDRIVQEVMELLYSQISENNKKPSFVLSDGTKCWIKKFHPPRKNEEDGILYGFDVSFSTNAPLAHLEFSVKCSGWERNLSETK